MSVSRPPLSLSSRSLGRTHSRVWEALKDGARHAALAGTELASLLLKLAFAMRILKGEMKQARRRYADHKARLERELQNAADVVTRATDKCARARAHWSQVETKGHASSTARDFERNATTIDKVSQS